MVEKKVPYQVNGRQFEGMIVYDDSVKGKRPVIFMQPDWKGVCADTIGQARAVAGKDYVVLMADMFGTGYGQKPKTVDDLRASMLAVHKDLPFTIACGSAAYKALLAEADKLGAIDANKNVAIGYCAGGGYVLEQARTGADFKAVVVFHVTNPNPVVPGTTCNIKGRVLAIHGSADPVTPKSMKRLRGGNDQGQCRLAGDDVRRRGALVLRSDGARRPDALRRKALPQVLYADARLLQRDAGWRKAYLLGEGYVHYQLTLGRMTGNVPLAGRILR